MIIMAQVAVSAILTVVTRKLSLSERKLFFVVGTLAYAAIALVGICASLVAAPGQFTLPGADVLPYLVLEGTLIPLNWLLQYKIIQNLGASNAVLFAVLNNTAVAGVGHWLLDESLTSSFLWGFTLIACSIGVALRIKADEESVRHVPLRIKALLVGSSMLAFTIGMVAEKVAIDALGVWQYAGIGWPLQFFGAVLLLLLLGRKEIRMVTPRVISKGTALGLLTSVSGLLYIYALSIGSLSHTIVAASGKVALVMILAAVFLRERNAMALRLAALCWLRLGLDFSSVSPPFFRNMAQRRSRLGPLLWSVELSVRARLEPVGRGRDVGSSIT